MDLTDILKLAKDKDVVNEISGKLNLEGGQVEDLLKMGLPAMLASMKKNVETKDGAESLSKALEKHKDADIEGMLKNLDMVD